MEETRDDLAGLLEALRLTRHTSPYLLWCEVSMMFALALFRRKPAR